MLSLVLLAGCHAVSATTEGARGEQRWLAADSTFGVEFLSPPWSVASESDEVLELEVPPELLGISFEGSPSHVFQLGHIDDLDELRTYTIEEEGGETDGDVDAETDEPESVPSVLDGVDLRDPYAVAQAELEILLEEEGAQLDYGASAFHMPTGVRAVEFQVQMDPGFFVRAFYIDARPTLVRATFVSLFDLDTADITWMARGIDTVTPEGR